MPNSSRNKTAVADGISLTTASWRIPFRSIEPLVWAVDCIIILASSILSGFAYHRWVVGGGGDLETSLAVGLLVAVNFTTVLAARGSYKPLGLIALQSRLKEAVTIWFIVFSLLLAVVFLLKVGATLSRGAIGTFLVVGLTSLIGWRTLLGSYLTKAFAHGSFAERRVLVIGAADEIDYSAGLYRLRRCGYRPIESFPVLESDFETASGMSERLRDMLSEAIRTAQSGRVEEILLAIPWDQRRLIDSIVAVLRIVPIPIRLAPDRSIEGLLHKPRKEIGSTWVVDLHRGPLTLSECAIKRAFDIVLSSVALITLAPTFLIAAVLIKLDSRGPVFFSQLRNGFNNKEFRILKFRTMTVMEQGTEVKQATRNDKRVTRLGRWLRRSSIDELPQFLNVLRGEMSLVGPRPHAVVHDDEYKMLISRYAFRLHLKPGITGWAQVNGLRGETATVELMEKRVDLDLWYINNWSLWLDIKILLRTFSAVVGQKEAY
jgi:undecaprenyl-phosphate galactose phosphotransferase/putative colanic acid biosynthesis UDP-glucose lipid carrier transferase